jgi:hypothetical protein
MRSEDEITKLYKNAGISKEPAIIPSSGEVIYWKNYPPFTAEKQIRIIKWLSDKADYIDIHYDRYKGIFNIQTGMGGLYVCNEFERALASRVNAIWQNLTEEEKQQVKGILE